MASDAHRGVKWRPITALADAREAIATLAAPEAVEQVLQVAPAAILAGERLPYVTRADAGGERRVRLPWRR